MVGVGTIRKRLFFKLHVFVSVFASISHFANVSVFVFCVLGFGVMYVSDPSRTLRIRYLMKYRFCIAQMSLFYNNVRMNSLFSKH